MGKKYLRALALKYPDRTWKTPKISAGASGAFETGHTFRIQVERGFCVTANAVIASGKGFSSPYVEISNTMF